MSSFRAKKAALLSGKPAKKSGGAKAPAPARSAAPRAVRATGEAQPRTGGGGGATRSSGLSAAQRAEKAKEAQELFDAGMRYLQTSLFRRKPDHLAAAPQFDRAARLWRAADNFEDAKNAYISAAESYGESQSLTLSAQMYEQCALLNEAQDNGREACRLYREGAMAYSVDAKPDQAAIFLCKAGRAVVTESLEEAVALHSEAASLAVDDAAVESGGEGFRGSTTMLSAMRLVFDFFCEYAQFSAALGLAPRMEVMLTDMGQNLELRQFYLCETVMTLATGGYGAADELFRAKHLQKSEYLTSRECKVEEDLLNCFRLYDEEALARCKRENRLLQINRHVVKVLKRLTLDGCGAVPPADAADDGADGGAAAAAGDQVFRADPAGALADATAGLSVGDQAKGEEEDDGEDDEIDLT